MNHDDDDDAPRRVAEREEYLVELFELRRAVRSAAPRLAAEIIAAAGGKE